MSTLWQGLAEYFSHCGAVTAVRLAGNKGGRKAWIEFGTKESARSAREYDNTVSTCHSTALLCDCCRRRNTGEVNQYATRTAICLVDVHVTELLLSQGTSTFWEKLRGIPPQAKAKRNCADVQFCRLDLLVKTLVCSISSHCQQI